jgi:heme exporter protein D
MSTLSQTAQRSPLGVSAVALGASLPSLGALFALGQDGFYFEWRAFAIAGLSLCLSTAAVVNLVRAETRGYSSTRIGLSVTALFFSFVPSIGLMWKLLRHIGEQP